MIINGLNKTLGSRGCENSNEKFVLSIQLMGVEGSIVAVNVVFNLLSLSIAIISLTTIPFSLPGSHYYKSVPILLNLG
jgi:hypothetical protein